MRKIMKQRIIGTEGRISNKSRISRFVFEKQTTSKQEIALLLGLSMPTVLQNIKELKDEGIIVEDGEYQSTGGRRAKALTIQENFKFAAGAEITKNHLNFVLADIKGTIRAHERIRLPYEDSAEYYKALGRSLDGFLQQGGVQREMLLGAGIAIPGIIDTDSNLLVRSHVLNVSNISLNRFREFIPGNVRFDNDANCAARAELIAGKKDAVYLSLNNSVGGAMYMNGGFKTGDNFKAAEFGHMIIKAGGKECYCGKKGCVDSYCSARVLLKHTEDNLDVFFERLLKGENACVKEWDQYLDNLAIAITNLRMVFDCEIMLGGYVGGYMDSYLSQLNEKIMKYNIFEADAFYVTTGQYKREASPMGIAMMLAQDFYDSL